MPHPQWCWQHFDHLTPCLLAHESHTPNSWTKPLIRGCSSRSERIRSPLGESRRLLRTTSCAYANQSTIIFKLTMVINSLLKKHIQKNSHLKPNNQNISLYSCLASLIQSINYPTYSHIWVINPFIALAIGPFRTLLTQQPIYLCKTETKFLSQIDYRAPYTQMSLWPDSCW